MPPPTDNPACSIVIVEQNEDFRDVLRVFLEMQGHRVSAAEKGVEGMELILRQQPDVAFVGLETRDTDGWEIARSLKALGCRATLVAMSGRVRLGDEERALSAGFDRYVPKPPELMALERMAKDAYRKRTAD